MFDTITIIIALSLAVLGFISGPLGCKILNKIPAHWLCDYDEKPSEELKNGVRFQLKPFGLIFGAVCAVTMSAAAFVYGLSYLLPALVLLFFVMVLISAADGKYTIIPDQFTVAVAVIGLITAVIDILTEKRFVSQWYSPILGALVGGGLLFLLDMVSTLLFKKTGFGFGDVKLMAALGIMLGIKYVLILVMMSSFVAAFHFLYLIFAGKAKKGIYLPMGPYICVGTVFTLLLEPKIAEILNLYKMLLEMEVLP